ncbi:hypothetical protein NSP34_25840, partial [Salmonella enterica]|nr:hypothetical protein [Salmonella enterica]
MVNLFPTNVDCHYGFLRGKMVYRNALSAAGLFLTMALAGCSTTSPFQTSTASYSSVTDAAYVLPTVPVQKIA